MVVPTLYRILIKATHIKARIFKKILSIQGVHVLAFNWGTLIKWIFAVV